MEYNIDEQMQNFEELESLKQDMVLRGDLTFWIEMAKVNYNKQKDSNYFYAWAIQKMAARIGNCGKIARLLELFFRVNYPQTAQACDKEGVRLYIEALVEMIDNSKLDDFIYSVVNKSKE